MRGSRSKALRSRQAELGYLAIYGVLGRHERSRDGRVVDGRAITFRNQSGIHEFVVICSTNSPFSILFLRPCYNQRCTLLHYMKVLDEAGQVSIAAK